MNNDDIAYCYHTLGISNGNPAWSLVRKSYRKLMNQWHPDRARNASSQRIAEDRTKTINVAYQKLARFYEEHGYLPPNPSGFRERAPPLSTTTTQPGSAPRTATAAESKPGRHTADWTHDSPRYGWYGLRFLLALAIAVVAVSIFFIPVLNTPDPDKSPVNIVRPENLISSNRQRPANPPVFTLGSTLGQVITAQGVPTQVDNNTWYFGQSKVVFENGVVTTWEQHPDHPLHIDTEQTANRLAREFFTYGSSRAHVSAIQGKPTRIENDVWHYGTSKIFFNDNKVVSWQESPLNPLRAQK